MLLLNLPTPIITDDLSTKIEIEMYLIVLLIVAHIIGLIYLLSSQRRQSDNIKELRNRLEGYMSVSGKHQEGQMHGQELLSQALRHQAESLAKMEKDLRDVVIILKSKND